jgi:hypothetical protein
MARPFILKFSAIVSIAFGCNLIAGCFGAPKHSSSTQADIGPIPSIQVSLKTRGLPESFFQPGADTKCANQIIGYRFVVWLDSQNVAVGFNTSPNCRQSPDNEVSGTLRILVFDQKGSLNASRDLSYLADGNGELIAPGEGMQGPDGTLLVRIESVNLTKDGRNESKSGVRLLDAKLTDVVQLDRFLEQTTLIDHALVFQDGFTFRGPRTYSIEDGPAAKEVTHRQIDWPTGTMDRKIGEHGFAFMYCGQELRPGEYTSTNVVHVGAKFRCSLNVLGEDGEAWTFPLADGETAAVVGILRDGSVVGQVHTRGSNLERLVIWSKGGHSEFLPWLPAQFAGEVGTAAHDFSRYASFAANDARPCNPIGRVLGRACDETGYGRWFVFDRRSQSPIVDRAFPKNGRAALSPDGLHYASFESNELRIYSLPAFQ